LDYDLADFWMFRTAYEDANGSGSFARLANVPEPAAGLVTLMALLEMIPITSRSTRRGTVGND
jgi:hypothetical protein